MVCPDVSAEQCPLLFRPVQCCSNSRNWHQGPPLHPSTDSTLSANTGRPLKQLHTIYTSCGSCMGGMIEAGPEGPPPTQQCHDYPFAWLCLHAWLAKPSQTTCSLRAKDPVAQNTPHTPSHTFPHVFAACSAHLPSGLALTASPTLQLFVHKQPWSCGQKFLQYSGMGLG